MNALPKVSLLGCGITTGRFAAIQKHLLALAAARRSAYVCFANVHMLWETSRHPDFRRVVNEADVVSPDGRPLSVLMRLRYGIAQERACGMDMFPTLLREAAARGLRVFFYGGAPDTLRQVVEKARREHPTLQIAGSHSPPFRALTPEEDTRDTEMIRESGAHLVFVSLGCPKQERWMHAHQSRIDACMLGVGQAFLTYIGAEKRLPRWARDYSLEWAYRLWLEPKRLWRRYLLGNSWFLWNAAGAVLLRR